MISREALALHCHNVLACDKYSDYAPNGLQVEGREKISRICTAVTASEGVIAQAIAWSADAVLVHHGYFWRGEDPLITSMKRSRIAKLLSSNVNLFAYHLPLDCHPELGNNACLGQLLSVSNIQMHQIGQNANLLWSGTLSTAMKPEELSFYLEQQLKRRPLYLSGQKKSIKRIAWCTGGAQDFIVDAARLSVDAYLSGEVSERTYYQAQELGLDYFACGHHATERYGIQSLGNHLAHLFQLEHQFIDSDNPV